MAAVLDITAHIGQVHQQCCHTVPDRFLRIADLLQSMIASTQDDND